MIATAPVDDLLLLMWGRNRPDSPRLEVAGRRELLEFWAAKAIMG